MVRFKTNWISESPRAKYRVQLGGYPRQLKGIPGTRWLYYCHEREDLHSTVIRFIDGMTGFSTNEDIVISPEGTYYSYYGPVFQSLAPNEILLGTSGNIST